MRCTVTGEPYTVFGYGGKQVRDNIHSADLVAAFAAFHARPAPGRGLQHRRRPQLELLDARGDRALRADRRRELTGASTRRRASATTAGGSATSRRSSATTPAGSSLRHRGDPARDLRAERRALGRSRPMKLSVVIPAHNEAGSIGAHARADVAVRSTRREIDYELLVVDDASSDGRPPRSSRRSAERTRASAACRSPLPPGFGFAVRYGLEQLRGRRGLRS